MIDKYISDVYPELNDDILWFMQLMDHRYLCNATHIRSSFNLLENQLTILPLHGAVIRLNSELKKYSFTEFNEISVAGNSIISANNLLESYCILGNQICTINSNETVTVEYDSVKYEHSNIDRDVYSPLTALMASLHMSSFNNVYDLMNKLSIAKRNIPQKVSVQQRTKNTKTVSSKVFKL